ncbi:MAG: N-acetyltransferase [Campylobacterota bacterium]|nr:N-acetyltransferase [Campylobacterota bacterium]
MSIKYQKATIHDIKQMQKLVYEKVEDGTILKRSDEEIATNVRSYTLVFDELKLIGFCALHIHTPTLAEIRSLIVDESYRGKKVGSTLVNKCVDEAKELGLKEVLSLTYKGEFFQYLGFSIIPMSSLPQSKIWVDCIKCKHFPQCNEISLIKKL